MFKDIHFFIFTDNLKVTVLISFIIVPYDAVSYTHLNFFISFDIKNHIGHFCIKLEINTCFFQISLHWEDQRFILVIFCKFQCAEIRKPCNMVDRCV